MEIKEVSSLAKQFSSAFQMTLEMCSYEAQKWESHL